MSFAATLTPRGDAAGYAAYRAWVEAHRSAFGPAARATETVALLEEYRTLLPACAVARCPFCDAPVSETFDAFTLNGPGWYGPPAGFGWFPGRNTVEPLAPDCPHLRIVAWYLNLEGRTPDDLFADRVVRTGPEVPSIMRVPMRADGAIAIIHPLPVGRWDDPAPAHHYTTWFVSYFTPSREAFAAATADWGVHYGRIEFGDVDYDLSAWASQGRMRWLESGGTLAPAGAAFPYPAIDGDRAHERILRASGVEHPTDGLIGRVLRWFDR